LPLKEADLKTVGTYKKAIRQDVNKITDNGATKFWVYQDIELPNDQGKKEKIAIFLALVDDTGIRNFIHGKKFVCSGTCKLEAGKVAFEPLKGKVPYSKLKTAVPLLLGKPLHLPLNAEEEEGGEAVEHEGEEQSGALPPLPPVASAPPPPPAPPPGANLAVAWAALLKECQAAAAANPARKDALMHAASGIPDLIKANNVKDATAKMEALKALLLAPPPPPPPPPAPPPGANLAAAWNALLKECQAAVAANPARKDALMHAASGIPDLIKANNIKDATAKMDALKALLQAPPPPPPAPPANLVAAWNELVKEYQAAVAANPARRDGLAHAAAGIPDLIRSNPAEAKKKMDALAAMLAAPSAAPPPAPPPHDAAAAEAFEKRYEAVEKQLLEVLKNPASDASSLRAAAAFAKEKGEAGDYGAAEKALDRLEALLAKTPDAAAGTPYKGIVAYRKSLLEFEKARQAVDAQVAALAKAVADKSPVYADLADALEEQLSGLNEEIGDAIDEAMSIAENQSAPVTDAVKTSIQDYLNQVASSPLVKRADTNPFGVNVSIEKMLVAALEHVRQSLPVPA
jgi:hypothetical protein